MALTVGAYLPQTYLRQPTEQEIVQSAELEETAEALGDDDFCRCVWNFHREYDKWQYHGDGKNPAVSVFFGVIRKGYAGYDFLYAVLLHFHLWQRWDGNMEYVWERMEFQFKIPEGYARDRSDQWTYYMKITGYYKK